MPWDVFISSPVQLDQDDPVLCSSILAIGHERSILRRKAEAYDLILEKLLRWQPEVNRLLGIQGR